MTYDEAREVFRHLRLPARHPDMGKGWTVEWEDSGTLWFVNPVTGSRVGFKLTPADVIRNDWETVDG